MKMYFKTDFKRIGHAARVARYADKLVEPEKGDPAVVLAAAYLHDIGIKEAEKKYQSSAARYQHLEGPPVARAILEKLDADPRLIDEVCDIVGHHHKPRPHETTNFKIVYDADLLVNLEERKNKHRVTSQMLERHIETRFLTTSGKALAQSILLADEASEQKKQ